MGVAHPGSILTSLRVHRSEWLQCDGLIATTSFVYCMAGNNLFTHSSTGIVAVRARSLRTPAQEGFWLRNCQGIQGWTEAWGGEVGGGGHLSLHLGYLHEGLASDGQGISSRHIY